MRCGVNSICPKGRHRLQFEWSIDQVLERREEKRYTGTNNSQIANTSFVKNAIDNLIANSPAALDTLNELATAINNDATFATTLLNTINAGLALKAPINNPVFTGTLTAPTPVNSSNDTTVATTAFVKNTTPPLNNAALTGVPTTPTPSAGDNSTKIANEVV